MALKKLLNRWQGENKYKGVEKRKSIRVVYPPNKRPRLKIRDHLLEVINISEKGMKVLNYKQQEFGKKVSGTVAFSNGESIDITGKIVWKHGKEIGLFTTPIPRSVIMEEVRNLLRKED